MTEILQRIGRVRRVVTAGQLSVDTHITVERLPQANEDVLVSDWEDLPGGAAANVAAAVAVGGFPATVISRVGVDAEGELLTADMRSYGVRTDRVVVDPNRRTSHLLVTKEASGARSFFLDLRGASFHLDVMDVSLGDEELLCFVGCRLDLAVEVSLSFPSIAKAVSLGFWVASREVEASDKLRAVLDVSDLVFMNAEEYGLLPTAVRAYLHAWVEVGRNLVITDCAKPARVIVAGAQHLVNPESGVELVDTIGCGDAFMGAYIASLLQGAGPVEACASGHRLAARVAASTLERIKPDRE